MRPIIAFIHIEKCGGTSLIRMLRRQFGSGHVDLIPQDHDAMVATPRDVAKATRLIPWTRSIAGHCVRPELLSALPSLRSYTLLRDPVDRYISDYAHSFDYHSIGVEFEEWMASFSRHNFMTKALAGGYEDLEAAISALNRIDLVGCLPDIEGFLKALRHLSGGATTATVDKVNTAQGRRSMLDLPLLKQRSGDEARKLNQLDVQLFDYAKHHRARESQRELLDQLPVPAVYRGSRGLSAELVNRVVRNLYYKPAMGYRPGVHALAEYRAR